MNSVPVKTKFQQVIEDGVPEADRSLVSGHAQMLLNTQGGIPSGAARNAVAQYQRLGRDQFITMTYGAEEEALRACGCTACLRDLERITTIRNGAAR